MSDVIRYAILVCSGCAIETYAQGAVVKDSPLEETVVTYSPRLPSDSSENVASSFKLDVEIEKLKLDNLKMLLERSPGLNYTETGLSTQVRIRGIGSDNSQGFEQSVPLYFDGTYMAKAQMYRAPTFDIRSVEVVRGADPFLAGKNNIAGAILVESNDPTADTEGYIRAGYVDGTAEKYTEAALGGNLGSAGLGRIAVRVSNQDGYVDNTYLSRTEPQRKERAIRLSLAKDYAGYSLLLKAEQSTYDTKGRAVEVTRDVAGERGITYSEALDSLGLPAFESRQDYSKQTDLYDESNNTLSRISLVAERDVGFGTLDLHTSYLRLDYEETCDCDYVPVKILDFYTEEKYDQFGQNLSLAFNSSGRLSGSIGLGYQIYEQEFSDEVRVNQGNILTALVSNLLLDTGVKRSFEQSSTALQARGFMQFDISRNIRLMAGGRLTHERKDGSKVINVTNNGEDKDLELLGWLYYQTLGVETQQLTTGYGLRDPRTNDVVSQVALIDGGYDVTGEINETAFEPGISVQFDTSQSTTVTLGYARGFKSGGFDPRSNMTGLLAHPAWENEVPRADSSRSFEFDSERSDTAFLRADAARGPVTGTVYAYATDYKDLQFSQFDGASGFNVGNIDETEIWGVELSGTLDFGGNAGVRAALSYLDFEYKRFEAGNCNSTNSVSTSAGRVDLDGDGDFELCSYSGRRGVYTPETSGNILLYKGFSFSGDASIEAGVMATYNGEQDVHVNLDPSGVVGGHALVDAYLELRMGNWRILASGKNLTNEYVKTFSGDVPLSERQAGSNSFYTFLGQPRTLGLQLQYSF